MIAEKVRQALYGKLNVSGVTSLCNGIFHLMVPPNTLPDYVVFQRQGPSPIVYSFGSSGPTSQLEDDLWLIKAVTMDGTSSAQIKAAAILDACQTAIGSSLNLSGATNVACYRQNDIPEYQEKLADRVLYHTGSLWRIASHL